MAKDFLDSWITEDYPGGVRPLRSSGRLEHELAFLIAHTRQNALQSSNETLQDAVRATLANRVRP